VSWEEQKWSVNGDGLCPNEVTGAPSSEENGHYKRGRHFAGSNNGTHNTKKPIQQPFETPNAIHNLKPQTHLQVCTPS
jgi:hypothetical protein